MVVKITSQDILNALIAYSDEKIWASELALNGRERRIDFWTLEPTLSKGFRTTAYEIKISKADFNRDSEEKQQYALMFADRFWYVTPPNLLDKTAIPDWAGLQEWDGQQFRVAKKPPRLAKCEPTWEFIVSLIRNSGDTRRDIGLLKTEIAFLKMQNDTLRKQQKIRQERSFQKLIEAGRRAAIKRQENMPIEPALHLEPPTIPATRRRPDRPII
jgi:hypothetical protein